MALLFSCGLDSAHWSDSTILDLFDGNSGTIDMQTGGPYNTGQLRVYNGYFHKNIPQRTTVRVGFWHYHTTYGAGAANRGHYVEFWSGADGGGEKLCYFQLSLTPDTPPEGEWGIAEYDDTKTFGGVSMGSAGAWRWLEFEIVVSATVGQARVWSNGTLLLEATGLDTAGSYTSGPLSFSLRSPSSDGGSSFWIDDIVAWDSNGSVMNSAPIGVIKIEPLQPNGDGTTTDWAPSSGTTSYEMINEAISDGDTTYVETSTTGHVDEIDFEAPVGDGFLGLAVHVQAKRVDAGTGTMRVGVKSSSSSSTSDTSLADSAGYKYCSHFTSVDPATSAAWTNSGIASAQLTYENEA